MYRARYNRILLFFGGLILHMIWWDIFLPKIGLRGLSQRTRPGRLRKFAVAFRALAIRMGGVMIKVGQFLSSRLDVLPREFTDELSGLQDEVQPAAFEDIQKVLDAELSRPIEEIFIDFQQEPLAAASIGQVYRARLNMGEGKPAPDVVIKVQRPNIEAIVGVDLAALRIVSRWVDLYPPIRRRMSMPALMEEFSASLYEEIDYLQEGRNAEKFAANFANQTAICIPSVFWSQTTRRVLTLEHIQAIKITDYAAIEAAGLNRHNIAERLFNTYLQQIFEDRFFHADPHPGNLFVLPAASDEDPEAWKLVFVDFGMVGSLSEKLLSGLRELLIAIGTQDAARLIRAYQSMQILLPGADVELIQHASAEAFSRFWGRTAPELASMSRNEINQFIQEFGDVLYNMPFQVPENFILLGRCVGILSGICSGLDADFNLWQQVVPYTRKLIDTQRSGGLDFLLREGGDILRVAVGLPRRTDELITRLELGKLSLQTPDIKLQLQRVNTSLRRLTAAVLFAALFLGSVQLYQGGQSLPAAIAGGAGLLMLLLGLVGR
jgi:predicted unusual protein kinase regulating ubiquinone biosynthesis (AarF/ABC1/UbiB family)